MLNVCGTNTVPPFKIIRGCVPCESNSPKKQVLIRKSCEVKGISMVCDSELAHEIFPVTVTSGRLGSVPPKSFVFPAKMKISVMFQSPPIVAVVELDAPPTQLGPISAMAVAAFD